MRRTLESFHPHDKLITTIINRMAMSTNVTCLHFPTRLANHKNHHNSPTKLMGCSFGKRQSSEELELSEALRESKLAWIREQRQRRLKRVRNTTRKPKRKSRSLTTLEAPKLTSRSAALHRLETKLQKVGKRKDSLSQRRISEL